MEAIDAENGGRRRRSYDEAFKRDAVRLISEEKYSFKAAAAAAICRSTRADTAHVLTGCCRCSSRRPPDTPRTAKHRCKISCRAHFQTEEPGTQCHEAPREAPHTL